MQIPCIIWLMLRKPKKYGLSWTINIVSFNCASGAVKFESQICPCSYCSDSLCSCLTYQICIVIGVVLTLISPIGGLRQIILDAKSFKLYS